MTKGSDTSFST